MAKQRKTHILGPFVLATMVKKIARLQPSSRAISFTDPDKPGGVLRTVLILFRATGACRFAFGNADLR
jgi:hypothetical protein